MEHGVDVQALLRQAEAILAKHHDRAANPNSPIGQLVDEFFVLRTEKDKLKDAATQLQHKMDGLELMIVEKMNAEDMDTVRTKSGTFSVKPKSMPAIEDFIQFIKWVNEDIDNRIGFIQKKVNEKPVNEMLENEGMLPPGVKTHLQDKINIRKAK